MSYVLRFFEGVVGGFALSATFFLGLGAILARTVIWRRDYKAITEREEKLEKGWADLRQQAAAMEEGIARHNQQVTIDTARMSLQFKRSCLLLNRLHLLAQDALNYIYDGSWHKTSIGTRVQWITDCSNRGVGIVSAPKGWNAALHDVPPDGMLVTKGVASDDFMEWRAHRYIMKMDSAQIDERSLWTPK